MKSMARWTFHSMSFIAGFSLCCAAMGQTQPERWTVSDLGAFALSQGELNDAGQIIGVVGTQIYSLGAQGAQFIPTNAPSHYVVQGRINEKGDTLFTVGNVNYFAAAGQSPQAITVPGGPSIGLDNQGRILSTTDTRSWITVPETSQSSELTYPDGRPIRIIFASRNGHVHGQDSSTPLSQSELVKVEGTQVNVVSSGPFYGDRVVDVTDEGRLLENGALGYSYYYATLSGPAGDTANGTVIEYTGMPYRGRTGHIGATGVNDAGNVVGSIFFPDRFSTDPTPQSAFITGKNGAPPVNLNSVAKLPGVFFKYALDINNHNQVLAVGTDGHTYLLTPVPEPGALLLLSGGLAVALAMTRKSRA